MNTEEVKRLPINAKDVKRVDELMVYLISVISEVIDHAKNGESIIVNGVPVVNKSLSDAVFKRKISLLRNRRRTLQTLKGLLSV